MDQRPLKDLISDDPAIPLVREWAAVAVRPVEFLPPSSQREQVLVQTQVTTRSPMGAIAYETGGILIDHGWVRVLGSGHPRLSRTLPGWNERRADRFYLVADDAIGGFFALNGGALGDDLGNIHYFAPASLRWESMGFGYSDFIHWLFVGKLDLFYDDVRWSGWERDAANLPGDRCFSFFPPLFTKEGKGAKNRREIPVDEAWGVQMSFKTQLDSGQE